MEVEDKTSEEILKMMQNSVSDMYRRMFLQGFGTHCHAYLELNGIASKFLNMCQAAHAKDIDFRHANVHSGQALPFEVHDAVYLAEKLNCMFGPALQANPEAKAAFLAALDKGH